MYTIHTTPGFIIESKPVGESGKLLSIFTRDLGLVRASAQGVRLEKSKLRCHTQEFSFGEYSFVRGKETWRLTSADRQRDEKMTIGGAELVARIALLLRRLLRGEEIHSELFDEIESAACFLDLHRNMSDEKMSALESLTVFRIMRLLGYVGNDKSLDDHLFNDRYSEILIDAASAKRKILNMHINKALKESQL